MEISHLYSLSTLKKTFDIKTLNDIIPVTISFDPNRYIPSGSPGIVNKDTLFNASPMAGELVSVLFPFPPKTGINPGTCVKIHNKNIYQLPQKNLIGGHKVKPIDTFNIEKIGEIRDFVKSNTAITFAMFDARKGSNFFATIPNLCSRYKHSAFFYHCGDGLSGNIRDTNDVFVSFVSFIDINYCIPIFDHRKVDGMGVYCGFMYNNKHGRCPVLIDVLCFVLSNHQENLLYADGVKITPESKISADILNYMMQRIKLKSECRMEDKTKKVKKEKIPCIHEDSVTMEQKACTNIKAGIYTDIKVGKGEPLTWASQTSNSTSTVAYEAGSSWS